MSKKGQENFSLSMLYLPSSKVAIRREKKMYVGKQIEIKKNTESLKQIYRQIIINENFSLIE